MGGPGGFKALDKFEERKALAQRFAITYSMNEKSIASKPESAYPEFDELAFAMLNDLMFFSGLTKHIYFTRIGMSNEKNDWGSLRSRVKACETSVYRIEDYSEAEAVYEIVLTELQSIFVECLATAARLNKSGVTPWGPDREEDFKVKLIRLEVLVLMRSLVTVTHDDCSN